MRGKIQPQIHLFSQEFPQLKKKNELGVTKKHLKELTKKQAKLPLDPEKDCIARRMLSDFGSRNRLVDFKLQVSQKLAEWIETNPLGVKKNQKTSTI